MIQNIVIAYCILSFQPSFKMFIFLQILPPGFVKLHTSSPFTISSVLNHNQQN